MKIFILFLMPLLSFGQQHMRIIAVPETDTLEATIFLNNVAVPVSTGEQYRSAFPVIGYVVAYSGGIMYYIDGHASSSSPHPSIKIICYLDHKKRLINSVNVWDYKLREK